MTLLQQAKQAYRIRRNWLGEGGKPSPHAQERADICLMCVQNDDSRPLEEATKKLAVRAFMGLKQQNGWWVRGEEELHLCDKCGCVLATKVFVPLDVARADTPDWKTLMPENCWMHRDDLK